MQRGRLLFGQDIYSDRERKMIQGRLQSNFKMKSERKDNDNTVIDGELTCCDANSFAVYAYGTMKYSLFSGMYLFPGNEGLALEVSCKKCGKRINIFNSNVDGYSKRFVYNYVRLSEVTDRREACLLLDQAISNVENVWNEEQAKMEPIDIFLKYDNYIDEFILGVDISEFEYKDLVARRKLLEQNLL